MSRDGSILASNKPDAAALCFRSPQDAINFARDGVEDAKRRAAFDAIEIVECYKEGKIYVVLKVRAGIDLSEYDLFFFAVKGGCEHPHTAAATAGHLHSIDACISTGNTNRHEESVLVGVTEFVQGPEGIIPSLLRVERAKERTDFRRQVFASAFNVRVQFGRGVGEGEIGVFWGSHASPDRNGISTLVQSGSKSLNGLNGNICPAIRDFASKLKAMGGDSVSIRLSKGAAWFLFEKSMDTLFQASDMLLVNRRRIGTPDRHPKGTPSFCVSND